MGWKFELWAVGARDINPTRIVSLKWSQNPQTGDLVAMLRMEGNEGVSVLDGVEADALFRYAYGARVRPPVMPEGARQEVMASLFPPTDASMDGEGSEWDVSPIVDALERKEKKEVTPVAIGVALGKIQLRVGASR